MLTKEQIKSANAEIAKVRQELFPPVYKAIDTALADVALNALTPIDGAVGSYRFLLEGDEVNVKKAPGFPATATRGDIKLCEASQDITFKRLGKDVTIPMGTKAYRLFPVGA
jgi:hypothetical protein